MTTHVPGAPRSLVWGAITDGCLNHLGARVVYKGPAGFHGLGGLLTPRAADTQLTAYFLQLNVRPGGIWALGWGNYRCRGSAGLRRLGVPL